MAAGLSPTLSGPEDAQHPGQVAPGDAGQMKRLIEQVFLASSHAQALKRGRALIAQFRDRYLALLFASLMTASKRWRGVKMTPAVIKQLQLLRGETVMTASQKVLRNVEMRIFNASRFYRKIGT